MSRAEQDEIVTALIQKAFDLEASAAAMTRDDQRDERIQRYGEADGVRLAASLIQVRPAS
jgi:hypothetical protein